MRIKIAFAALVALIVAFIANAQTGSSLLTWIPATTYTDSLPMQLGSQKLYYARNFDTACNLVSAPTSFNLITSLTPGIATYQHSTLWNGTYYYTLTVIDIFGTSSANSNVACKRINITGNFEPPGPGVKPNPPSGLTVQ